VCSSLCIHILRLVCMYDLALRFPLFEHTLATKWTAKPDAYKLYDFLRRRKHIFIVIFKVLCKQIFPSYIGTFHLKEGGVLGVTGYKLIIASVYSYTSRVFVACWLVSKQKGNLYWKRKSATAAALALASCISHDNIGTTNFF